MRGAHIPFWGAEPSKRVLATMHTLVSLVYHSQEPLFRTARLFSAVSSTSQ